MTAPENTADDVQDPADPFVEDDFAKDSDPLVINLGEGIGGILDIVGGVLGRGHWRSPYPGAAAR